MTRTAPRASLRPVAPRVAAFAALVLFAAAAVACAASGPSGASSTTGGGDACAAHVTEARSKLQAVLDANATCSSDADCVEVGFGASCFDSCSRAMATSGKDAFDAERRAVDAGACKAYADEGCPAMIAPPCAPPGPLHCNAGRCE